jgi:hypothetical protein
MDPVSASLFLSSISAFAGIIQAWHAARELSKPVTLDDIEKQKIEQPSEEAVNELQDAIDPKILKALTGNVKKALRRFQKAILDPTNSNQTKEQEEKIARSAVCGDLARISRLNRGHLPTKELEKAWESFRCDCFGKKKKEKKTKPN